MTYTIATVTVEVVDDTPKFELIEGSHYSLNDKFVTIGETAATAATIDTQFKCNVSIRYVNGELLAVNGIADTGCVVQQINLLGEGVNSAVLVVVGDIDGDGIVTSADYIEMILLCKK